ncbi:hypothetical protein GCM10007382_11120 [Salinibacterium xinjiangense]|uniref:helix-turn-helix domain-containing protein n=1 Tax=Salinibacterium xinjiangense TaxID=386302 RepID=UPI000BE3D7D4|nr:helix-turn-helix domain-containing protein [Salinibacterium xinjiangense]GGK92691.1 hypothetical protein GCM10007382_11120 [Salinibacterium xinjiangense]
MLKFEASMHLNNDHIETLVVYLAHDQDVGRTARYLHVHANTVRYRLHKCEEILETSLHAAATITNLYLAFQDDVLALQDHIAAAGIAGGPGR